MRNVIREYGAGRDKEIEEGYERDQRIHALNQTQGRKGKARMGV